MIKIIIIGLALSSIWFWIASLFNRSHRADDDFKWWFKLIVPQGQLISWSLHLLGWL